MCDVLERDASFDDAYSRCLIIFHLSHALVNVCMETLIVRQILVQSWIHRGSVHFEYVSVCNLKPAVYFRQHWNTSSSTQFCSNVTIQHIRRACQRNKCWFLFKSHYIVHDNNTVVIIYLFIENHRISRAVMMESFSSIGRCLLAYTISASYLCGRHQFWMKYYVIDWNAKNGSWSNVMR